MQDKGEQQTQEESQPHHEAGEAKGQPELTETTESDTEAKEATNGSAQEKDSERAEDAPEGDSSELTQEKFDELRDKWMRALAEAENIRRRADRDVKDVARYQQTRLARDLLPVYDNLKRALATIEENQKESQSSVMEGIELTLKELLNAFGKHGVQVVAPQKGESFDSKLHEAMFQAPTEDVPAGQIVSVMTEGFTIHDRLLRPAQVAVSSGSPSQNK